MRRPVHFYTFVPAEAGQIAHVLMGDPARWLPTPAEPVEDAWRATLRAEAVLPGAAPTRLAIVRVSEKATSAGDITVRSLSWQAEEHEALYPQLEGDLELDSIGSGAAKLTLAGSYRPPLSVAGSVGDQLLGRHIADAVVRRFVLDVAERLVHAVGLAGSAAETGDAG